MNTVLLMIVLAALALSLVYLMSGPTQSLLLAQKNYAYAQAISQNSSNNTSVTGLVSSIHPGPDTSPIAAVVIIGTDMQGNTTYVPSNVTMKVGQEILVINNVTSSQSMTNGMGPDDPMAGKFFDTGPIPPKSFAEYVAANVSPGPYPFYSTNSTSTKGVLTIESNS